jgi:orotate phosphoribosyltransferase
MEAIMPKSQPTDLLHSLIRSDALTGGEFILKSGQRVEMYFDARKIFCHPVGGQLAAMRMARLIKPQFEYIGGVATGGIAPMSQVVREYLSDVPSCRGFYVRTLPKRHGRTTGMAGNAPYKLLEGYVPPSGSTVCMVEDVISTGTSVLHAVAILARIDVTVSQVVALIDRELGAVENLAAQGIELASVYRARDF